MTNPIYTHSHLAEFQCQVETLALGRHKFQDYHNRLWSERLRLIDVDVEWRIGHLMDVGVNGTEPKWPFPEWWSEDMHADDLEELIGYCEWHASHTDNTFEAIGINDLQLLLIAYHDAWTKSSGYIPENKITLLLDEGEWDLIDELVEKSGEATPWRADDYVDPRDAVEQEQILHDLRGIR